MNLEDKQGSDLVGLGDKNGFYSKRPGRKPSKESHELYAGRTMDPSTVQCNITTN